MPPDPTNPEFWTEEASRLYDALIAWVEAAFAGGVEGGIEALQAIGIFVNPQTLVNSEVAAFASTYTFNLAGEITGTRQAFVMDQIVQWIESGKPLDDLIDSLIPMFEPYQAERIAVTNVTNVFALGNIQAWRVNDVKGKRWRTAYDDLVCWICWPLEGKVSGLLEDGFTIGEGFGLFSPAAHPNCRCYLQPVV